MKGARSEVRVRCAPLRSLLLAAGLLGISACGFQLRSWDLGTSFGNVAITADESVSLERDLSRALELGGVSLVPANQADVVIALTEQEETRRSVSVAGDARTAEYEMTLSVEFAADNGDGTELVAPRRLEIEKTFRLDRDNVVGSSDEQALLIREMREDAVQRIMTTLGTVAARADAADGS